MFGEGFLQGFPRPYALPHPHLLLSLPSPLKHADPDSFPGRSPGAHLVLSQPHMQMRTLFVWGDPLTPTQCPHLVSHTTGQPSRLRSTCGMFSFWHYQGLELNPGCHCLCPLSLPAPAPHSPPPHLTWSTFISYQSPIPTMGQQCVWPYLALPARLLSLCLCNLE